MIPYAIKQTDINKGTYNQFITIRQEINLSTILSRFDKGKRTEHSKKMIENLYCLRSSHRKRSDLPSIPAHIANPEYTSTRVK